MLTPSLSIFHYFSHYFLEGHLAVSYANLMREMWQGSDSYASAHYLKKVIGKFAPQVIFI